MSTHPDRQKKIDQIFDNFLLNESDDESLDEKIEALEEVIYNALLEKLGYADSSEEQKKLVYQKMKQYMYDMDFNNPALVNAEKILHSMGASDFKKAAEYLNKLYEFRSKVLSISQSKKAQAPRKDPLSKLLERMVQINPGISAADAIAQLESDIHADVIIRFDDEYISYESAKGQEKCVAKSSIPSRLARLRNKK